MIPIVYYGNVEHLGTGTITSPDAVVSTIATPKDKGLYVSTFDVASIMDPGNTSTWAEGTGVLKKVDLLFYSRVNTLGKVLSTVVYVGEVRDIHDTSDIPYFPELMYRNSLVELGWELECVDDFTYVNYIRWEQGPESYFVKQNESLLPINGKPANVIASDTPVFDGWYTIISAGVYVNPTFTGGAWQGQHYGSLAQLSGESAIKISLVQNPEETNPAHWHDYTVWDNTINILGHFVDRKYEAQICNIDPPFIRQDFFITYVYNREYSRYLAIYATDSTSINDSFPPLKCKQRVIDRAASYNNFKEAQLYIQSTDYIRIKENII